MMKKRVIAFVDGFNLYHALDASVENGRLGDGTKKYHKPYAKFKSSALIVHLGSKLTEI